MNAADDQLVNERCDEAFAAWIDAMEHDEASLPAWMSTVGCTVIDRGSVRYVRTERRAA